MKRKIQLLKYALCVALGCMFLSSCEDFLDRQSDENLTFDKIWEKKATVKQYWLNAMSYLPNDNGSVGDNPYLGSSDECIIAWDRAYRKINYGTWNASNIPYDRFGRMYNGIRECNIFMQNVYRCSDKTVTKDQLDEWYWQARFARAYYYFLLMENYGPVFLLGDDLVDFSASTEELYRPRNTWEQCVDYVVSELTTCAENPGMPLQAGLDPTKYGLATKGVCRAVISRLLLYSARDLFNGNTTYRNVKNPVTSKYPELSGVNLFPQTYDANKWLEAAKAAKAVMDDGSYKLYRAGNNNPYEDYYGITEVDWNSELIWTDRRNNRNSWGQSTLPTGVAGTAYGAVGPTQSQVDAYAMSNGRYPITSYQKDGIPIADPASGYDVNSELQKSSWTYPRKGWTKQTTDVTITAPNMFKDREPRFYVTVFFGDNYWYHGTASTKISFAKGGNGNKSHDFSKSGYLVNRCYNHMLNSADGQWGTITFPLFRLGETYLNFIESVLECKKRGVTLPGDYEAKAMEVWADLRNRSGMAPITDIYPGATTDELIELCRKERRVEMAFECSRYFDTRTWKIAETTDNGPIYGMNVEAAAPSATVTPDAFWKRTVAEKRVFKSNHYLYPFSQRELDRNKLLTQNYGW
ncbi:MAG: RagB/SusD family nutrient uptake outer membrane protein [Mediterranea sp.]|jgi:hypothetical protein|nr:RagB/SusD family nutrient uptake outer membrane protein [Mediterranea sp.]